MGWSWVARTLDGEVIEFSKFNWIYLVTRSLIFKSRRKETPVKDLVVEADIPGSVYIKAKPSEDGGREEKVSFLSST